jgi:uncharacterized coiled-coil DUF342 family protein
MRNLMMIGLALTVMLSAAPAAATDTRATVDQIVSDAQKVRAEALDIKQLLRASRPDLEQVQERLATLSTHADALKQAMDGFDVDGANLTAAQRAAFDRARAATDTLRVLLANKTTMIADAEAAMKNRGLLRAKADGIAKRADIVQQQLTQLRT